MTKMIWPALGVLVLTVSSCMNDETWVDRKKPDIPVSDMRSGQPVIILNEGNFMYGNASVTYYDAASRKVWNDVYYNQNGSPLGDVAFSAEEKDGLLYVVVNNSGKIMVLNAGKYPAIPAFSFVSKITGLTSPRYIFFISDRKAYVSDLYARAVTVVDPAQQAVTGYLATDNHSGQFYQHPTEQFVPFGDVLFTNCYSYDDKILVLDPAANAVIDSIEVLKQPSSMVIDKNGKLWVVCDGGYENSDYGDDVAGLVRIDAGTRTVERIFPLTAGDGLRSFILLRERIPFISSTEISGGCLPKLRNFPKSHFSERTTTSCITVSASIPVPLRFMLAMP